MNRSEMSDQEEKNVKTDVNCISVASSRLWGFLFNRHIPKCSKMCSKWIPFCVELFNKFNCFKINFIKNVIKSPSYNTEIVYEKIFLDQPHKLRHYTEYSSVCGAQAAGDTILKSANKTIVPSEKKNDRPSFWTYVIQWYETVFQIVELKEKLEPRVPNPTDGQPGHMKVPST